MPFSGGTAGAHTDAMHQGSAKRDVAEGVAGLDANGHVLSQGWRLVVPRGAANQITLRERIGDERVARWIRVAANDYEAYVNEAGVEKRVQTASMKNQNNGFAGLSPQGFLSKTVFNPVCEEFGTHFGATDAFWVNSVTGNGNYVHTLGTNHFVTCGTGTAAIGYSRLYTQQAHGFDAHFTIVSFIVRAHVIGVGGVRKTCIGLKAQTYNANLVNAVMFYCDGAGQWSAVCASAALHTLVNIAAINDSDLLTVVANTSVAYFYVNGVYATMITTNIPAGNLSEVGAVHAEDVNVTAERVLQLHMMTYKYIPGVF